jgi:chorismate mutase
MVRDAAARKTGVAALIEKGPEDTATPVPRCHLALDIRHALAASAPDSIEALREMLGNLESQLVSLYEEKEQGWQHAHPAPADEALTALYEDKQRLSTRTIAELRSSVDSLAAQLAEFYEAREHGRDHAQSGMQETLDNLTVQLHALYEEREQGAFTSALGTPAHDALLATVQSFEAQLASLYEERAHAPYSHHEAIEMVHSLEAQVAALLEERNHLAEQVARAAADVSHAKQRARELVNALVDQSFA